MYQILSTISRIKSVQRNGEIVVFSELDHIAAVREPDITLLGDKLHSSRESGGEGRERGAS